MRTAFLAAAGWFFITLTGPATATIADDELDWRLRLAAQFLGRIQAEDGQFRYEFDFVTSRYSKKNSIVRQAGTAHALAEYLRATGERKFALAVHRAIEMLAGRSVSHAGGVVVSADNTAANAQTGTGALTLLTVLFYTEATGDDKFAAFQSDLVDGLAALQMKDGHFEGRPGSGQSSPYFDGEAWYALAEFSRVMPNDDRVKALLDKTDLAMMSDYTADPQIGFSHWGMLAASVRYASTREARFLEFLEEQARIFIDDLRPKRNRRVNNCYSIEGLGSAAAALAQGQPTGELWARMVARVHGDTRNNNRFQILPGQRAIELGAGSKPVHRKLGEFEGAFLNGQHRPQTRIDFTQHCMSALLKYKALKAFGDIELNLEKSQ